MGATEIHTHGVTDQYWVAYLASSIGHYLADMQTRDLLEQDYRAFLDSPLAQGSWRAQLPAPPDHTPDPYGELRKVVRKPPRRSQHV